MNEYEIQSFYTFLQSQQTAQNFLMKCYRNNQEVVTETKSYENCNSFIYYLKHGLHFYEAGKKIDIILQPILFFYGMVHLLKATLLTKRPNYPETTKLLAHGVSSRKRKKKHYIFMDDEVKIQHQGLFPYFSKYLFHIEKLPFDKVKMEDLFALIPEMNLLFTFKNDPKLIKVGTIGKKQLTFPAKILDHYYLTEKAFLNRITPFIQDIQSISSPKGFIHINLLRPFIKSTGPFFFNSENHKIYFPMNRKHFLSISEVMIHYLLLYNLSMISRYETEWWGDLTATKSEIDYPFIVHFLKLTSKKIPILLGNQLYQMYLNLKNL